ncbi:MAG: hypothetical protein WCK59_02620 [Candidatus Falkowbacteria bacterium]
MIEPKFKIENRLQGNGFLAKSSRGKLIDLKAEPYLPKSEEWIVEEHLGYWSLDSIRFKASEIILFPGPNDRIANGYDLRTELSRGNKLILNGNVLDWLLANQEYIPEEWKGKYIHFLGTVYRRLGCNFSEAYKREDALHVRSLYWGGSKFCDGDSWLGRKFNASNPVALISKKVGI